MLSMYLSNNILHSLLKISTVQYHKELSLSSSVSHLPKLGTDGISGCRVPEISLDEAVHKTGADLAPSRGDNYVPKSKCLFIDKPP